MRRSPSRIAALASGAVAVGCGPIAATRPAASCGGDRPVVIVRQADITALAGCTTLRGVTIRSAAPLDVSALRQLATITGDLTIGPTVAVDEIQLGELRAVLGTIHIVANGLVTGVFLPRLERAGRIAVDGNASLTTVSLPRLAAVHGALQVTDNASLEALDLPALLTVDQDLVLDGDPVLTVLDAPQLRRTGALALAAPRLPHDVADRLRTIAVAPRL
jgi:hypothetical protein